MHSRSTRSLSTWALVFWASMFCSCASNYFVEPIGVPHFTSAWQTTVQADVDAHRKLYFAADMALPDNFLMRVIFSPWSSGLTNDQRFLSFGLGHFWLLQSSSPLGSSSLSVLTGLSEGAHKMVDAQGMTGDNFLEARMTGNSDFRKYFLTGSVSLPVAYARIGNDTLIIRSGGATRLSYLDRYRFYESVRQWTTFNNYQNDTSVVITTGAQPIWILDFSPFFEIGYFHISMLGELRFTYPFSIPDNRFFDYISSSLGLRYTF